MTNTDFTETPLAGNKIFGTVEASVDFLEACRADNTLKRTLSALQRGPFHFYRNNVIAAEGDAGEYIFFVVNGVVRSCKTYENGARNIVAFSLPGDLFGWSDLTQSLSVEAATDTRVLFVKRRGLLSVASREIDVANFLLAVTSSKLARAQEHALLMGKDAKCRVAKFLIDLWTRLGKAKYLDVPMSYQDIADHLGLQNETVSRAITDLERSGLITRVSPHRLLLQNRFALGHMMN
ncbi:MAG TPA: helix-turn-helix domain-containing protein [Anaerolineales bacterium]|nr:helix-turn-helix domain-containing protein [Anaerolineales bacterium]